MVVEIIQQEKYQPMMSLHYMVKTVIIFMQNEIKYKKFYLYIVEYTRHFSSNDSI